jgi:phosphatidylglycerophosphatase A
MYLMWRTAGGKAEAMLSHQIVATHKSFAYGWAGFVAFTFAGMFKPTIISATTSRVKDTYE